MINLLPPELKQQLRFARWNRQALKYIQLLVVVGAVLAAGFLSTQWYVASRLRAAQADIDQQNASMARFHNLEAQAKSVNSRLASIKRIQDSQAHFSLLLSDLAAATPKGVAITSILLTGDDKKPVVVSATASDYRTAVSFRDSMAQAPRISAADIQSVTTDKGQTTVSISFTFHPGKAK